MNHDAIYHRQLEQLLRRALEEDEGDGDHTTRSCIDENARGKAVLLIKEEGILAGMEVAEKIFAIYDPEAEIKKIKADGDRMIPGETAFEVTAKIYTILTCERLLLNCMQRMSGIATLTSKYVERINGYPARLLDTRKTTPNFRLLEKEAVRIGGGLNHRFGLYDMIMLKDNHIDYCGGIELAVEKAWQYVQNNKPGLKIEVETRNLRDVEAAIATGKVNRIMLDNFTPAEIATAVKMIAGKFETEASGGITLENIEEYAATGVNYISSGAIIHHAVSLDLSLKAEIE
jgi:nicotinate-nucleotide pyrophosphorylase (carboxylating)